MNIYNIVPAYGTPEYEDFINGELYSSLKREVVQDTKKQLEKYDKIIVESNEKMTRVIEWYLSNQYWIDRNEFRAPFDAGVIELQEESIKILFETKSSNCVKIYIYMDDCFVCDYDYNPITKEYGEPRFFIKNENSLRLAHGLMQYDNTQYKESLKYHAIMMYSAYYREQVVQKARQKVSAPPPSHSRSKKSKKRKLNLVKKIYVIEVGVELKKDKNKYRKPTHEVSVNGHYRHYKSGKVVWVNSYTKYKNKGKKKPKEYKL